MLNTENSIDAEHSLEQTNPNLNAFCEDKNIQALQKILSTTKDIGGTKNYSEHLNCTKQECGSSWT